MRRADILARVDELIEEGRSRPRAAPIPVLRDRRVSFRIAVLVSGEGSNLQALLDELHGLAPIEIVGVASSRAEARGLERARGRRRRDRRLLARGRARPGRARRRAGGWLEEREVELVVLAGFMELLTPALHPPLRGPDRERPPVAPARLPGLGAIEQALEHGVKVAGRDGPLRRRGRGQRARSSCRKRSSFPTIAASRRSSSTFTRSSTACCRGRCG